MKELKELKLEELSLEQKLGMAMVATIWDEGCDIDYLEGLIKNHALGGIWVIPKEGQNDAVLKRLKDAADYPLLVYTDAENGFGDYTIGQHNALGITDNEELAYAFGKVTAAFAAKHGYNVICNPVLDMSDENSVCSGTTRILGGNKYRVTALAAAEARGVHDGGCLTVGKHYPGKVGNKEGIDSHMAETASAYTKEELLEYNLYPYLELDKQGLLDGVMLGHSRFYNIDPEYPASLSKDVFQILRDTGFEGIAITDALMMMGVVAKFGIKRFGLAIGNAGAVALPFGGVNDKDMERIRTCYDDGMIPDDRLDEVVKSVLLMQHKLLSLPQNVEPTEKDLADFERINTDSVFARADEGLATALDKDGQYYFAILTEAGNGGEVHVDTFSGDYYRPAEIASRLTELFPNAVTGTLSEFPSALEIQTFLNDTLDREVVFVTFTNGGPYLGEERFAPRIVSMMKAMQVTNRISTILHFGNPYMLEDLPHISRIVLGTPSSAGVDAAINVLSGAYPAKGSLTYSVTLK